MPLPLAQSSPRRRALVATLGLVVASVVAAGCLPPPPPPPAPVSPTTVGVTHAVATRQLTLIDWTRPTPAYGDFPGLGARLLQTTVWYPSDGGGPFPLVMFAHGYGNTPAAYAPLITRLAAAGYVVAAPTYPLLSGQPAGPTDTVGWEDLPADTSFVMTQVLARSAGGDPAIGGLIDPSRIAVAGHSDGAAIAFNVGFTPYKLDPRVRAVVSFAADLSYYGIYQPNGRPLLHVLSDEDVYNPYGDAIGWDRRTLQQPRTIVTLKRASHAEPFLSPGDGHFAIVVSMTIAFLDATLKNHPEQLFFASYDVYDHHSDLAVVE